MTTMDMGNPPKAVDYARMKDDLDHIEHYTNDGMPATLTSPGGIQRDNLAKADAKIAQVTQSGNALLQGLADGGYKGLYATYAAFSAALATLDDGLYRITQDEQLQADEGLNWAPASERAVSSGVVTGSVNLEKTRLDLQTDSELPKIILKPYLITGRANIRNPYWNAPIAGAEDSTTQARTANAAAMQAMLNSGAKYVELDDKARRIATTLTIPSALEIHGPGRQSNCLIWDGGDTPIIAQANYADANAAGSSNVRVCDLRIADLAAMRAANWAIDLTNGNGCGITNIHYDGAIGGALSNKYGVALGKRRGGTYSGTTYVAMVRNSRIVNGTLLINTTDWDIEGDDTQLWATNREYALMISGGGRFLGGQLVPGQVGGVFLFNDSGFDLATLNISDVYFDGGETTVFTGWGIVADTGIGLRNPVIKGNTFWHINRGGIRLEKLYGGSVVDNSFEDCDSDDTGSYTIGSTTYYEDDIVIADMYGAKVINSHYRAEAPKNGNASRVNLASPMRLTGKTGFSISDVGGVGPFTTTYSASVFTNAELMRMRGGNRFCRTQRSVLPNASVFSDELVNFNGAPYYSNGATFMPLVQGFPGVVTDVGDASKTLIPYTDVMTQKWDSPLTTQRNCSLLTTNAIAGARFNIVRTANSTGAAVLAVGTNPQKNLDTGQWCEIEYDGTDWRVIAFGSL